MNIQLVSTKAIQIKLDHLDVQPDNISESESFSFDFNPIFPEDKNESNTFVIVFTGEMENCKENYISKVVFASVFEVDELINADFLKDNFALINAPAIGYPYFRAFYSNLLLSSGYKPFILPTINFVQLRRDKLEEMNARS